MNDISTKPDAASPPVRGARRHDFAARLKIRLRTLRAEVEAFGIPFQHVPVTAATRAAAEQVALTLLDEAGVELVVLARYMQVLSPAFIARYAGRIINIHHSFLPAFAGADPY